MGLVEQKLGELLKLERERRQISLAEICSDIKIPQEVLEGIEKGDLSLLPTPVYYSLFARTYCQTLGIDCNRTLDAIKEEVAQEHRRSDKPKSVAIVEQARPVQEKHKAALRLNTPMKKSVGVAAILAIIFLAYWALDNLFSPDRLSRNGTSEMLKGVDAERLNALAGFNWDVPGYKPPAQLTISLKPKSESWCTVIADGDTVVFRRLTPGRDYTATGKYRLVVSIGVPEAVDVEMNGRLIDLRDPINQRISKVEINQANLEYFLNPTLDDQSSTNIGIFEQSRQQPGTASKVSINEGVSSPSESTGTALDNDES